MAPRRLNFRVEPGEGGRLLELLASWLPPALGHRVSNGAVRRLLVGGHVRMDGRAVRHPAGTARAGAEVDVDLVPDIVRAPEGPPDLSARILLHDGLVLAVDKPPGLPTHATADPERTHLVAAVERWLRSQGVGRPYVAVHQRLDAETSGVVLFAVSPTANAGLTRAFEEHAVRKTYLALTVRPARLPAERWLDERPLEVRRDGTVRIGKGVTARTRFHLLGTHATALSIEAEPETGRKHQIRVHLATSGLPILGDERYGAPVRPHVPRTMLHAARLQLAHPVTGKPLLLEAPVPPDFRPFLTVR